MKPWHIRGKGGKQRWQSEQLRRRQITKEFKRYCYLQNFCCCWCTFGISRLTTVFTHFKYLVLFHKTFIIIKSANCCLFWLVASVENDHKNISYYKTLKPTRLQACKWPKIVPLCLAQQLSILQHQSQVTLCSQFLFNPHYETCFMAFKEHSVAMCTRFSHW